MEQNNQLNAAMMACHNGNYDFTQSDYEELKRYTAWLINRFSPSSCMTLGIGAESVVSAVFGKFMQGYDPSRGALPMTYWTFLVRTHLSRLWKSYYLRQKWIVSVDIEDLVRWYNKPTTYDFDKARRLILLDLALQQLPEPDRVIIHRIYWLKESYARIGETVGCSRQMISIRHARILKQLRVCIESMEADNMEMRMPK